MKLSSLTVTGLLCVSGVASAGGLFLPGSGSISTARAGAGVASADDGEALALNPAGIAKSKGTVISIGIAAFDYIMSFQRNGNYDALANDATSYEGQRYPVVENDPHPPLGIGPVQPVPAIAIITDLGQDIPALRSALAGEVHGALGLYAPSAYPFRNMSKVNGKTYTFNADFADPPPPSRYDILQQEAAIILPSVALSYSPHFIPGLDLGGRFSLGMAQLKSTVAVWGQPANYEEWIKADGTVTLDAKQNFMPAWSLGAAYHPTPTIEFGAQYVAQMDIHAKGTALAANGPAVTLSGAAIVIVPPPDNVARCAPGGTTALLKGCVDLALPATATIGGRYKFLDGDGKMKGDIELDVDWENWSSDRVTNYLVVIDGQVATVSNPMNGIDLKDNLVRHGLQDTYAARLGGSWTIPVEEQAVIVRGGLSYDTAAAKPGWERADIDGAARTMIAAGASYKMKRTQVDLGFGVILEGTRTDSRTCNPTGMAIPGGGTETGCKPDGTTGTGTDQLPDQRKGPDPINPLLGTNSQFENPVNAGTYKSHYLVFTLGFKTWF
ncbi:MAG: Long-chain fatty acid transport protein [Myxococcales bacterium]|nr:Long-chain fatty acid transport protein [Myxococcales bacterium]